SSKSAAQCQKKARRRCLPGGSGMGVPAGSPLLTGWHLCARPEEPPAMRPRVTVEFQVSSGAQKESPPTPAGLSFFGSKMVPMACFEGQVRPFPSAELKIAD